MKKTLPYLVLVLLVPYLGTAQTDEDLMQQLDVIQQEVVYGNPGDRESRKKFKKVRSLAEAGHGEAHALLGEMYKDGAGTRLNFNKARKHFKKAHELGSAMGAYSLGYMYLKGLGNVPQDYKKAVKWFEQSNDAMAWHWLAKCHYHGYGVPADRERAMNMLKRNPIDNSRVLLAQWEFEKQKGGEQQKESLPGTKGTVIGPVGDGSSDVSTVGSHISDDTVLGQWHGEWQLMDWSGQKQERTVPIALELSDNGT
ncbi:MAG: tetratricopeptide repeat protein, partial [Bacteroidota bacterium]